VKRVIGLPGDTIEMRNEQLVINGQPVEYTTPDIRIGAELSETERERATFATEKLPARPHEVMALSGVPAMRSFGPVQVAAEHYFMMGDNRDDSFDSRYFGTVSRDKIVGRAVAVVLSLDKMHYWLPRWSRTCSALDSKAPAADSVN
jgi:signal peptidase I